MTDKGKLKEELNQGTLIYDHGFVPRKKSEPWGLCECGLGEAAHAETLHPYRPRSLKALREQPSANNGYYNTGRVPTEVQNAVDGDTD